MSAGQSIGPYQLVEKLGAGGMGEVYKAQDTRMGRYVALKILPESMAEESERRRRFEQEARMAAALNHPNIMAIYDVGLDIHPPYIVAELVAGESLRAVITRGALPVKKAIDVAAQTAAGLAAAHSAGIVHRDLKPENLMVTPDGTVKILDFGVARMESKAAAPGQTATMGQTAAGAVIGTAAYMSPEQARALEVDYRSDQFSLGLVLYEMLGGRQAFARPSAVQTMSAIVEDDPPPLDRPIPPQLRWILDRCLAKEREARYESTRDLARDLGQLRDHFSELTSSAATGVATAIRPRRRVAAKAMAAGVAASALAAWCAASLLQNPYRADIARYRLAPFAIDLAEQFSPSWSPDGKSIAFLGRLTSGKVELFVQPVDAYSAVPVSGDDVEGNTGHAPVWSPDARSIYFRCTLRSGPWGLCRVPATGGTSTLVQEQELAATMAPDGAGLVTFTYDRNLWILSPPGAPPRKYEPAPVKIDSYYNLPTLAFAPDGRKIVFSIALAGRGETSWLLPWPPGPAQRVFPKTSEFAFTPRWSWFPDSRHLAFADSLLYLADLSDGQYTPALVQDRPASWAAVSPDSKRIAYVSSLSHTDLVAVPLGEGPVRTLLGGSATQQMADVSPSGQQLVYISNRRGSTDVWLYSLAEGWERPLVKASDIHSGGETAQALMTPTFSRDGRRVALVAKLPSSERIFTVFANGGTPVEITNDKGGFELTPTWSPDGNWLAYSELQGARRMLLKMRPGSGDPPVPLAPCVGSGLPEWSPAGDWITCHQGEQGKLVLINAETKAVRDLPGDSGPVTWSRDGKTLYQVQFDPPVLAAIDIATGQTRKLRDLGDLVPYAAMHPGLKASLTGDGKSIVYTVNRPRQEIWILDGLRTPRPWYKRLWP